MEYSIVFYTLDNGLKIMGKRPEIEISDPDSSLIHIDVALVELIATQNGAGFMPIVLGDTIINSDKVTSTTYLEKNHPLTSAYLQVLAGITSPPPLLSTH